MRYHFYLERNSHMEVKFDILRALFYLGLYGNRIKNDLSLLRISPGADRLGFDFDA